MKILLVLVSLTVSVYSGTDFYELLGVSRSATTKEIRKAFKKLALIKHPDKNADNPEAHEEFLKINRAYETLKDDDLRKKYDTYGEEGLKDDFHGRGRRYESWRYYQEEFGLYDDDPEIITLGHHDFETSVEGSEDIWFINFYSPHCSHCHQLAPTWRELARELEGVIRIGAVNCGDDLMTCRSQGVRAYPTLLLYPQRIKYNGERTTQLLVDFAMRDLQAKVHTIWESTFKSTVTEQSDLPWLMTFCGDGGDCLSEMTALKLSVMLDGLARVGTVDCHTDERICENLDVDFGTRYFPKGNVNKGAGLPIDSLYPKDVMRMVLEQLPDVTVLDKSAFQDIIATLKSNPGADPWIIHFVDGGSSDLELRKLPAMLQDFQIGRVDCSQMRTECNQRHIHKFPTFVVYKPGGSYEIFYGRLTAHDVAVFAKDSMVTPIQTLGPSDFPHRVVNSREHWFVDFFAPWCPPCMRLLPEFRKAAKDMGYTVNFGTVDCTVHSSLCRQYQIHSYPTTIFYNRSQPHQYQGHHDATHMAEFLEDTMKPPVVILDPSSFDRLVKGRDQDEVWLVDFFAPWCGPCRQVAPEWSRLAKSLKEVKNVYVGHVDCQAHPHLCRAQGVHSYPSLWLYPTGRGTTPHPYEGWQRDAYSLRAWAYEFLPSLVQALRWRTFQEIFQGSEPWIIDFYTPWCGHCQVFKPEFERVAEALEGHVKAGKVDCESYPRICQHAGIHSYPSVRLYPGTHVFGGQEQGAYGWNIQSQNAEEIIQFVRDNTRYAQQQKIHHDEF